MISGPAEGFRSQAEILAFIADFYQSSPWYTVSYLDDTQLSISSLDDNILTHSTPKDGKDLYLGTFVVSISETDTGWYLVSVKYR